LANREDSRFVRGWFALDDWPSYDRLSSSYLARATQMVLAELIQHIEAIDPGMPPSHTARMLLLIAQSCGESLESLTDRASIEKILQPIQLQLQSALDQESAVAEELDQLAATRPAEFNPSHVWTLIRAIKVQKQILDLFVSVEPQVV
jgi:hypothetical protein